MAVRGGRFALAAFFITAPAFAIGGVLGLAPMQALMGALGAPWRRLLRQNAQSWALFALLLGFVAWTAASALWSPNPETLQGARLFGGVFFGVLFVRAAGADPASQRIVRAFGAACLVITIAGLALEALASMPLNRMAQPDAETGWLMRNPARGASAMAIMVWGAIATLVGGRAYERWLWKLIALGAGYIAFQFDMSANAIAFLIGGVVFAIAFYAFRFTLWALLISLAGWLLAAPWATPEILTRLGDHLPQSWRARGEIWRFACAHIERQPVIGWGLDASRVFNHANIDGHVFAPIPLHPHSGSLQIWLETGGVGASLAAACLIAAGFAAQRAFRDQAAAGAGLCAVIASAGFIANVSYGVWQEWQIAAIFAGVALAIAARRGELD